MTTKRSLADLLGRNRSTIITITDTPEIREEMKKFGYTDERLDWGKTKLTAVESFFEKQKKEQAEAYAASKQYLEERAHVADFYRKDVKLLRIPARSNPELDKLLQEARDPEVGVIVMDFVLGFGAHEDPVGVMIDAIKEAQAIAKADNRPLAILGYVLGTDQDPQSLAQQCQLLTDAGVIWASSSTNTGLLAREFVCKGENA